MKIVKGGLKQVYISLLGSFSKRIEEFFTGIFAFIPQVIYFLYTCFMSLLDVLQFIVRKLVGLDVYYVDGQAISGDIVSDFISGVLGINGNSPRYSALSTVFWSLVVFGCILLVLTTIITIIKNQYSYDAKKSHPMNIVFSSIKTFFLMAIIPLTCVFGIFISNVLLQAFDRITFPSSSAQIERVYKNSSGNYSLVFEEGTTATGDRTYASYDFFGATSYTNSATFSGIMFKVAARGANRVRTTAYTPSESSTVGTSNFKWSDFGIFTSTAASEETRREEVSEMIDFAFANCLTLRNKNTNASTNGSESAELKSSYVYFESAVWYLGLVNVSCFSKYNVGLVWYYYNLWSFNFFLGFAGAIALFIVFGSIVFGLMVRLVRILCLFLIYPSLIGVGPLDNNNAINQWQKQFLKDVLMGYGAVIGLNISFLILDELQKVYFFKSAILNTIMDMALIITLLAVLKDIIKMVSGFVGGEDASATGEETMKSVKEVGVAAGATTMKAGSIAMKIGMKFTPLGKALGAASKKANKKTAEANKKKQKVNQLKARKKGMQDNLGKEQDLANENVARFSGLMNKNVGKEGSVEAINDMDKFSADTGDDTAKETYKRFSKKYGEGANDIDSDASLTDEEKTEKKKALAQSLKDEAIDYYKENNEHATNAKQIMGDMAEDEEEIETLEEEIEKENVGFVKRVENGRDKRSRFANGLIDLGSATLKAVGEVTGIVPAFKKMEKNGDPLIENGKMLGQTIYQELGMTSQMDRVERGESKFSTAKQKQKSQKNEMSERQEAVDRQKQETARFNKEIQNLAREIKRLKDEGKL